MPKRQTELKTNEKQSRTIIIKQYATTLTKVKPKQIQKIQELDYNLDKKH